MTFLDLKSTPGLSCLQGFELMPEEGICGSACEEDIDYRGHDVGNQRGLPDLGACREHCSTLPEAKFFGWLPQSENGNESFCQCKRSDAGRQELSRWTSCPI